MSRRISFLATTQLQLLIKKIREDRGWTISEVIRRGIELLDEKLSRQKYGYAGSVGSVALIEKKSSKDTRKEAISLLQSSDDKAITTFVQSTGFYPNDTKPVDGILNTYFFKDNWWNHLYTYQNPDGTEKFGCPPFKEPIFEREGLIRELIKAKLI